MIWKTEYVKEQDNISVKGYSVSEADCRAYCASRVSSKIAESDGTEQLQTYLEELETTGFDVSALLTQTEAAPQAKDWEIGEAFAETLLEDEHDAIFPWETGWDKRTRKASLPGADIVGIHNKAAPRFIFGQVKSSSEDRVPPQVINSGNDCLKKQMHCLRHNVAERQQLVQWLLLRMRGTAWENAFNEALVKYAKKDYYLVGLLVSGGRKVNSDDLTCICSDIQHTTDDGEIALFGYYLPFDKKDWGEMLQNMEETQ